MQPLEKDAVQARQRAMVERAIAQFRGDVAGRVAVVTGGARGIGKVIADALLAAGARVAAADKTWAGADAFRETLEASGNGAALEMDITADDQLDAAYASTLERFGTVDVLVNAAALVSETLFPPLGRVKTLATTDDDWQKMFGVNVFGTVKVIRRFIRPMIEKKSGSIINILSSGILPVTGGGGYYGLRPWSAEMPYQATKAALMALSFYLGEEVRADGVAVNAFMPGHTRASWFDATARGYLDQGAASYATRPGIPEHLVPISLFLAGQTGASVTGRLYFVPDWNYDHGFGNFAAWLDHTLPPDLDEAYRKVEAAATKFDRSGVPQAPFDASAAVYAAAVANLTKT
jgi:NAD(P)-dependent dehydrogenase (short-subunit alcohol dehydrogenase family)